MERHAIVIAQGCPNSLGGEITAGTARSPRHRNTKEMTMSKSTKILVAALALAATSLTFVANASAGPGQSGGWYQGGGETYQGQDAYMAICRSRFCS
jgi:hypothetical protein